LDQNYKTVKFKVWFNSRFQLFVVGMDDLYRVVKKTCHWPL